MNINVTCIYNNIDIIRDDSGRNYLMTT